MKKLMASLKLDKQQQQKLLYLLPWAALMLLGIVAEQHRNERAAAALYAVTVVYVLGKAILQFCRSQREKPLIRYIAAAWLEWLLPASKLLGMCISLARG